MMAGIVARASCVGLLLLALTQHRAHAAEPYADEPEISEQQATERTITVEKGDTLASILLSAGIDKSTAAEALAAIAPIFPPKSLRPGQEVALQFDPANDDTLRSIEIETIPGRTIRTRLLEKNWRADTVIAPQQRMLALAAGSIDGGLFPAAVEAGLPPGLALSFIRIMGHQVDFQRDLRQGDRFAILFERFRGTDGDVLGHGRILRVELDLSGRRLAFWRHESKDGSADWFDEKGQGVRRSFLKTPLDGARVSSGFGPRSHPMLGYTRMHRGTDFAAPTGTPVFASANGTVLSARAEGGYGRIVRLQHSAGTETRYAHLSRFARNIAPRRAVRQGDIIGYVGSTGLSTGPHLHYEVVISGRPVDPSRQVVRSARLTGRDLASFNAARQTLARYAGRIGEHAEVAMAE